jgi:hypothetical protein
MWFCTNLLLHRRYQTVCDFVPVCCYTDGIKLYVMLYQSVVTQTVPNYVWCCTSLLLHNGTKLYVMLYQFVVAQKVPNCMWFCTNLLLHRRYHTICDIEPICFCTDGTKLYVMLYHSVVAPTVPNYVWCCTNLLLHRRYQTMCDAVPIQMHTLKKQPAAHHEDWRWPNVGIFSTKLKPCQVISELLVFCNIT